METLTDLKKTLSPEPVVELINAFTRPYDNAVATARTCYSPRVIYPDDVSKDEAARLRRDAIASSIYKAGHHTTIQHATFQFVLNKVSRQFLWSFLHSHPFYNSEQVSQRYVEVRSENFVTPPLREETHPIYADAIQLLMQAYHRLIELLEPVVRREYVRIFPVRNPEEKKWKSAIKKRCQEVARYVLPVATHAHLYHTISGLTLHRYHRICQMLDTPLEQKIVVGKMVEAVLAIDPDFAKLIEHEIPLEDTLEFKLVNGLEESCRACGSKAFLQEFDRSLDGWSSKLIDYKQNAETVLAQSVRTVLGVPASAMSDGEAIDQVLNPAKNPYFSESLNLTTLSKLTRTLFHPHFTFRKKISHTADSQDQRHRMTPASRPILSRQFLPDEPDYVVPTLVEASSEASDFYHHTLRELWQRMARLLEAGEPEEYVLYLLPNAFPIRFEESGDLLNLHHKWVHRLCYTAQEEIWKACKEEVEQVQKVFPQVARYITAPCGLRKEAGERPFCPEGDRFCGVIVWNLPLGKYERVI